VKKLLILLVCLLAFPAFAQHAGIAPKAGATMLSGTSANGPQGQAGPVAGANTQVVFNDGGVAAGDAGLTFLKASGTLTIGGMVVSVSARYLTATRPTCDESLQGTVWFVAGAEHMKDSFTVCAKDAGDLYNWRIIY
jgi:hypothetical protein